MTKLHSMRMCARTSVASAVVLAKARRRDQLLAALINPTRLSLIQYHQGIWRMPSCERLKASRELDRSFPFKLTGLVCVKRAGFAEGTGEVWRLGNGLVKRISASEGAAYGQRGGTAGRESNRVSTKSRIQTPAEPHSGSLSRLSGCSPSFSVFRYLCPSRLATMTSACLPPSSV